MVLDTATNPVTNKHKHFSFNAEARRDNDLERMSKIKEKLTCKKIPSIPRQKTWRIFFIVVPALPLYFSYHSFWKQRNESIWTLIQTARRYRRERL